ncbi:hypothetical protein [Microbulbifer aggregans]|uniref:hypothetical protein n=1 Tax=Microbulbifer aggregans TaxID=1769779 RepID=UPI001CFD2D65|nr:hypothetical protein [Microbulbifer aggregans]
MTELTSTQLQTLQGILDSENYPEAYEFLADINDSKGGDSRTPNWLRAAAHINRPRNGEWSFYKCLVRGTRVWAANDKREEEGLPKIGDAEFQDASDRLAIDVITTIVDGGAIPSIDDTISTDAAAVGYLGLDMENWVGTAAGDWYQTVRLQIRP